MPCGDPFVLFTILVSVRAAFFVLSCSPLHITRLIIRSGSAA